MMDCESQEMCLVETSAGERETQGQGGMKVVARDVGIKDMYADGGQCVTCRVPIRGWINGWHAI